MPEKCCKTYGVRHGNHFELPFHLAGEAGPVLTLLHQFLHGAFHESLYELSRT